jgi:nucleoside-diphosphate-sugar epimerase
MASGHTGPINLGTDELVTINELVDTACAVAGKRLHKRHDLSKPQGVRGRNSDNSLLRDLANWEPKTNLASGIEQTYPWIWSELDRQGRAKSAKGGLAGARRG